MTTTRIELGDGHVALLDTVDEPRVSGLRWYALRGHNGKVYAVAQTGQRGELVYMHRLVANTPGGMETDHRNGDGLDNRRSNLRPATASQNRANTGKPKRPGGVAHSSTYKGVSWDRARQRWQAKIQLDGQHRSLGRYDDEQAAAHAYDAAAHAAWGAFARPNFPLAAVAA